MNGFHQLLESAKKQFGDEATKKLLQPSCGSIPFLVACEEGQLEMAKELLASFKEIDMMKLCTQKKKENALHLSVSNKQDEIAYFLLENSSFGKELLAEETSDGLRPIDCALRSGTLEMLQYLWKREPSHTLEQFGEAVYFVASQGEGLEFLERDVLTSAKKHYGKEMDKILNFQKEESTSSSSEEPGPLMLLMPFAAPSHGQEPELTKPPLICAAEKGFSEIVKILLSFKETDITIEYNSDNYTALHGASEFGHLEIVKMLLETPHFSRDEKLDLLSVKQYGRLTPLDIAKKNYRKEVVEYLERSREN